ncbi:hypothetical protein TIFTF001_004560 [Ficus carica]|uniref:Uncharacterized protein n=1 Tax=Ficus carica TaxID=3494 RepID=A0AA87ZL74_FICCA|nr:hypothetical protein TIFTF001_004560 [Ficus carica]
MAAQFALLVVLLLLANPAGLSPAVARRINFDFNTKLFTGYFTSCTLNSCNVTVEDKRGVPSGANPLHNR